MKNRVVWLVPMLLAASLGTSSGGQTPLRNGSFEKTGENPHCPPGWSGWGRSLTQMEDWSKARDGGKVMVVDAGGNEINAGLWQDLAVAPGICYEFSIYASRDKTAEEPSDLRIELSLESSFDESPVTINTQQFDLAALDGHPHWSRLSIRGTATSDRLRVLIRINPPSRKGFRGSLYLDQAGIQPVQPPR